MKKELTRITLTGLITLFAGAAIAQNGIAAGTPYVYIGSAGVNNSTLPVQLFTAANTAVTSLSGANNLSGTTTRVNGFGVNPVDGMLYGLGFPGSAGVTTAHLYKTGADGTTTQVGEIPGPSAVIGIVNTTAGTVDAMGNYWFTAYSYNGIPFPTATLNNLTVYMGRIKSVHSLPAGNSTLAVEYFTLDITDPGLQQGFQAFLDAFDFSNPGSSDGGMEDIALNPVDQKFYSYLTYPNPSNTSELIGRPIIIDMATLKASAAGSVLNSPSMNGAPNREMAGIYFDGTGNMFGLFTDGQYAQIDIQNGGGLLGITQSNLPLDNDNLRGDLASNVPVVPLPAVLNTFSGEAANHTNKLTWTVVSQQNVAEYIVEKSTDAKSFARTGAVKSNSGLKYTFSDDAANSGTSYYRLKIVDRNGKHSYSGTLKINTATTEGDATTVYPTLLTAQQLYIHTPVKAVTVTVTNLSGQRFAIENYKSETGNSLHSLMLPVLKSGNYLVSVYNAESGDLLLAQRITKL